MIGDILLDKDNKPINAQLSAYKPPQDVLDLTAKIQRDYAIGWRIQTQPFPEFNDKSFIQRLDIDKKATNNYVMPESSDPEEVWMWNGTRPITRKQVIDTLAQMVVQTKYPGVFAQNKQDEEDKLVSSVMRDMVEYNCRNSEYELSFMFFIFGALFSPITYLESDFAKIAQTIKKKLADGKITEEEAEDEILSGFHANVVPGDEILISDAYAGINIQKQRFIIRKRYKDYDQLEGKYKDHPNWKYVKPGIKTIFMAENSLFYDQKDDALGTLCEEDIYYNRREDIEVPYVNGIYLGDKNVNANRIGHRDAKDRPKYKYVPLGFEPIDEGRFFFYKSLAFKSSNDNELADELWRIFVNGSILEGMPPMAVFGDGSLNTSVMYPAKVTYMGKDGKAEPIGVGRNLTGLLAALRETEQSMAGNTQPALNQPIEGVDTAYERSKIEEHAKIQMTIFGRLIAYAIAQFGQLMIDGIIRFQTIGELSEITAGDTELKYRTFLLPEQNEKGKKITKKIKFRGDLTGKKISDEDLEKEQWRIFKEEGGEEGSARIYEVNPEAFRNMKFSIVISADTFLPKSEALDRFDKREAYKLMIENPYVEHEAVTQDFLVEPLVEGNSSKYMRKKPEIPNEIQQMMEMSGQKKQKAAGLAMKMQASPEMANILG